MRNEQDEKRRSLASAAGVPQVGRRDAPEGEDPKKRRMIYVRGLILGAVVVAATLVIVAVVGANTPL